MPARSSKHRYTVDRGGGDGIVRVGNSGRTNTYACEFLCVCVRVYSPEISLLVRRGGDEGVVILVIVLSIAIRLLLPEVGRRVHVVRRVALLLINAGAIQLRRRVRPADA